MPGPQMHISPPPPFFVKKKKIMDLEVELRALEALGRHSTISPSDWEGFLDGPGPLLMTLSLFL